MKTPHTPGPLIAANASHGRILSTWGIYKDGKRIATVLESDSPATECANARLIAAAPDLLAALQACEALLDGRQPKDIPGALMVIRSAIAKAKA